MKKIFIIFSLLNLGMATQVAHAQEADRFVGAQHVKFQTACHPEDVKHYDTKLLRERFVMEKVMAPDSILLTYSHYDRFIFGGAMPVKTTLKLENFWELGLDVDNTIKEKYFMYNRELGVVNCGLGDGVVIVDGKEYALSPKEALYIGRGHIGKDKDVNKVVEFRSKDASKPAKFYLNSATAHQHYKTQWITLDGRKGSLKAAVWGPVGSLEECNNRTVYKLIVNDVLEEGPCQLQLGLTQLNPGAAWNTMPPHTHGRRIEAYYYFNLPQEQTIAHIMGQPEESRVVWLHNDQAIMSPEWSMHAAAGTYYYTFIWGMAGENLYYNDKDNIPVIDIVGFADYHLTIKNYSMSDFGKMVDEKCLLFAARVVNLCRFLDKERKGRFATDQLVRSGMSIGANFAEAECAISDNDFLAKQYISLKECNETLYWLRLLRIVNDIDEKQFNSIFTDGEEIKRLLVSIIKTKHKNMEIENS